MTRYPAAYCHTCETSLSPAGSRTLAEEAREAHVRSELKFRGVQHSVEIQEAPPEQR